MAQGSLWPFPQKWTRKDLAELQELQERPSRRESSWSLTEWTLQREPSYINTDSEGITDDQVHHTGGVRHIHIQMSAGPE